MEMPLKCYQVQGERSQINQGWCLIFGGLAPENLRENRPISSKEKGWSPKHHFSEAMWCDPLVVSVSSTKHYLSPGIIKLHAPFWGDQTWCRYLVMFDGLPDSTLFGLVSYILTSYSLKLTQQKTWNKFLSYFLGINFTIRLIQMFYGFPKSGGPGFLEKNISDSQPQGFLVIPIICTCFVFFWNFRHDLYYKLYQKKETCVFCVVSVDCFSGRSRSQRCDNMKRSSIWKWPRCWMSGMRWRGKQTSRCLPKEETSLSWRFGGLVLLTLAGCT